MDREQWLAGTHEEVLEPEIPIVDTHHHWWDHQQELFSDTRHYLLEQLVADAGENNVRQTVFVECDSMYRATGPEAFRPLGEVEWANGLAAQSASGEYGSLRAATGIVGNPDLELGDGVVPVLEAMIAAAPHRFRGVRHKAAWADTSFVPYPRPWMRPGILLDAKFREGFRWLRVYGLTFEAFVFHPQLPDVADLARAFPDTTIILNHLGTPLGIGPNEGKQDQVFDAWRVGMAKVAQCENVMLKVGGLQMPVCGFGWHERETAPTSDELIADSERWYSYAIEQFGPARCMFESNFPVDRMSCSYTVLWNQFKKLTRGYRQDERRAMFHDNAIRVYRLPDW